MAGRDTDVEKVFLDAVMRQARPCVRAGGHPEPEDFPARVRARLEKGAREYADRPADTRPLEELLAELAEEGADLGGWAVVAARHPAVFSHPGRDELLRALVAIAALGVQVNALVDRLSAAMSETS